MGVDIYSSKTVAWIFKESKWAFSKLATVFLNGCLHYIGFREGYHRIFAVNMEEKAWRKIPNWPRGFSCSIHQAQGHLCQCTVGGHNMSKLSIWILEDYGTDNWTLKHTVTMWILFGRINIRFGFLDFVDEDIVIIVHPEWNLIFFVGVIGLATAVIAYNMDNRKVHAIPIHYIPYGTHDILPEIIGRP